MRGFLCDSIGFATLPLLLCVFLSGCSAKKDPIPAPDISVVKPAAQPASPFSLEIIEDINDGSNLHIHGRVQSATSWPADDIVVRLSGMKSGEALKVAFYPLPSLQQKKADAQIVSQILPGAPLDFYLSVPSAELTDYQLELLWGKEAKSVAPKTPPMNGKAGLVLQSISVQRLISNCSAEPCPATYRLTGSLLNNSEVEVQQASLGVGFVWVPTGTNLDLSAQIPQDEENVEITGLNLAPQQSRPFKLEIDRVVPEVPQGSFQPVVRIISVSEQTALTAR